MMNLHVLSLDCACVEVDGSHGFSSAFSEESSVIVSYRGITLQGLLQNNLLFE